MSHRRQSFCFILSLPLLLSKSPHHARESVGRRKSSRLSVALTIPHLRTASPREEVCRHRLSAFLLEDISSALKGGVKVCQRQLVNEAARVPSYRVRSQFELRGRDTGSARLPPWPSRSHLGWSRWNVRLRLAELLPILGPACWPFSSQFGLLPILGPGCWAFASQFRSARAVCH